MISPRSCDSCGIQIQKATRIFCGNSFCLKCYCRYFRPKPCEKCGQLTRAHQSESKPICSKCRRIGRKCFRCGREVVKAGRLLNGEAICNSCSPHFRTPKPCGRCGRNSTRLTRISGVSQVPICEFCVRNLTHVTCQNCGKNRPRHTLSIPPRRLCRKCFENPSASHQCPVCGSAVPGVGNWPCKPCYIRKLLLKKSELLSTMHRSPVTRQMWCDFIAWLESTKFVLKSLKNLANFSNLISRIDSLKMESGPLNDDIVMSLYSPEELRRAWIFSEYLAQMGILTSSNVGRRQISEKLRCKNILEKSRGHQFSRDLIGYYDSLSSNVPALAVGSIRNYLNSAFRFLILSKVDSARDLEAVHFRRLLRWRPGHAANLTRFISHFELSNKFRSVRPPKRQVKNPLKSNSRLVDRLLLASNSTTSRRRRLAYFAKLISLVYGLPLDYVLTLKYSHFRVNGFGIFILISGNWVLLENEISLLFRSVIDLEEFDIERRLFPGRHGIDTLSSASIYYHVLREKKKMPAVSTNGIPLSKRILPKRKLPKLRI
jgi:hypothetical protein